jgi:hypothetical protein
VAGMDQTRPRQWVGDEPKRGRKRRLKFVTSLKPQASAVAHFHAIVAALAEHRTRLLQPQLQYALREGQAALMQKLWM